MFLIEKNNTIYMGKDMINSFSNLIQCEDNDVRIFFHPKLYDTNNNYSQSVTFPDGTSISVGYNGVLSCIAVSKPTK